jgi:type I restriction enzyme S subunit
VTRQDIRWLYFALKSLRLTDLNKATGVPGLNRNDAYERKLLVPSLEEQRRIAVILDYADGIRRKRDQMLVMADDVLKSAFLEMFGHPLHPAPRSELSTLGQECDFFAGNSLPQSTEFTGQDDGLFLLKVSDLNSPGNETIVTSAKIWATSEESVRGGVIAPEGAIVFPKRGGAIATNKKRILGRRSVLDPNLMAVFPKPGSVISLEYLRSWFAFIDLTSITSGSAVPQLNKRDLDPLPFVVPDPAEIGMFTELSRKTAQLIGRLRKDACDAFNLYQGLVQRAFRGEL